MKSYLCRTAKEKSRKTRCLVLMFNVSRIFYLATDDFHSCIKFCIHVEVYGFLTTTIWKILSKCNKMKKPAKPLRSWSAIRKRVFFSLFSPHESHNFLRLFFYIVFFFHPITRFWVLFIAFAQYSLLDSQYEPLGLCRQG